MIRFILFKTLPINYAYAQNVADNPEQQEYYKGDNIIESNSNLRNQSFMSKNQKNFQGS